MDQKFRKANSLSIYQVLVDHGVELSGSGDNIQTLSPFRKSTHKTSFSVCISRNTFMDWKLDYGGGPVKFIMKLMDISEDEAVDYLINRYYNGVIIPKTYVPPKVEQKAPLDPAKLDTAYRTFLSMCNLTGEDLKYLTAERQLTAEEIDEFGLKSFPLRTIRHDLQTHLIEQGIDPAEIPGFFQYDDDDIITFSRYVGVIIPIKDVSGKILGLQIRKRKLKDESDNRYVWFSSSFAKNKEGKKREFRFEGRGPESPLGFVPGTFSAKSVTTLFVTEGFFKAIAIRKYLRSPSITVQGVTNWRKLGDYIKELKEVYPKLSRVIFALDADFICNLNVSTQMCKMYKSLEETFPEITYCTMLWEIEDGKGIDDLLNNVGRDGIVSHMRLLPMEQFKMAFDAFLPTGKELAAADVSDEVFAAEYKKFLAR